MNGPNNTNQAVNVESDRRPKDHSPEFDITSYTNGNMNELMEEEVKREKAEFMY